MGIIEDIKPPSRKAQRAYEEYEASKLPTEILVQELWQRGVSIKDIFAHYYEREAAADGKKMTVEDAELAHGTVIHRKAPF